MCSLNSSHPYYRRTIHFKNRAEVTKEFNYKDIVNLYGDNPRCYLTGEEIDISDSKSFHFDHLIPISKGGKSDLENLRICKREANQAKGDLTLEEFIELCNKVILTYSTSGGAKHGEERSNSN